MVELLENLFHVLHMSNDKEVCAFTLCMIVHTLYTLL